MKTLALLLLPLAALAAEPADTWRAERRTIDMHVHVDGSLGGFARAAKILDRAGVGVGVDLIAGTVTHKEGEKSKFERTKALTDKAFPGRFLHYMNIDYTGWDEPGWSEAAAKQVVEGFRLGAAGLKEWKRLGLFLRDGKKNLIRIDDPKLDAVWAKCGELGLPVSIHVADPRAFWLPYDDKNERWTELKDHKSWWFGDPKVHPPREELLAALDRVIGRHPKTTFVCVHFANNSEDLDWVAARLDEHPNMNADLAARIPELGRHDPGKARAMFTKFADRIFFATDFMVYDKLILGSGGDSDNPTDDDANTFYQKCWRYLETNDRDWEHMTPIQGPWKISAIGLPADVQRKIYFDNARRLLARSLPLPTLRAGHTARDFKPDGKLDDKEWQQAEPVRLEYQSHNSVARPELSTTVRALWSDEYLYLYYQCPYKQLTVFAPTQKAERMGLWDRDVVEAFIGTTDKITQYTEYEWAPNGESLDLKLDLPAKDFEWSSGMESTIIVDEQPGIWTCEVRIPMKSLSTEPPKAGTKWRINLFRHDAAGKAGLAFSPTLRGSFHTPERAGWLLLQ